MIYVLSIVIDLAFAAWAGIGKAWYIYPFNFVLLFIASGIINTSYIQGITRIYSDFYRRGQRWILDVIGLFVFTLILFAVAYFIVRLVFTTTIQSVFFFIACILLATVVAFIDKQFDVAIARTKSINEMAQAIEAKNKNKN